MIPPDESEAIESTIAVDTGISPVHIIDSSIAAKTIADKYLSPDESIDVSIASPLSSITSPSIIEEPEDRIPSVSEVLTPEQLEAKRKELDAKLKEEDAEIKKYKTEGRLLTGEELLKYMGDNKITPSRTLLLVEKFLDDGSAVLIRQEYREMIRAILDKERDGDIDNKFALASASIIKNYATELVNKEAYGARTAIGLVFVRESGDGKIQIIEQSSGAAAKLKSLGISDSNATNSAFEISPGKYKGAILDTDGLSRPRGKRYIYYAYKAVKTTFGGTSQPIFEVGKYLKENISKLNNIFNKEAADKLAKEVESLD